MALYERLPVPLQNVACSWQGYRESRIRFGAEFRRRLALLTEAERWSRGEIEAYQDEQIRALVRHAFERVPYYREVMDALRLRPDDIRGRADLPKLPVTTKEAVRRHAPRMLATGVPPRRLIRRHTSGTTGKSLEFFSTPDSVAFQWAVWWRHRRRFGVEPGDLHANFTGKLVVPQGQDRPPFWRWNRPMAQALLNMHHMTPRNAAAVMRFLGSRDFVYYSGYPSVIHALAAAARAQGIDLERRPQWVFTGAENVLDYQRRDIEAFTGARISDQYGFSEGCGNASQCESFVYHEDFEFGYLEADGSDTGDGAQQANIVATGFACPQFPLIRYSVGDTAIWENSRFRCRCGRESRAIRGIEGRIDDYVVTPEGRRIMRFDYVFKDTTNVRECQVVQERLGAIVLRAVIRPGYGARDEVFIRSEIARWISPLLEVRFEYVDEIERGANGKFRAVKSLLTRSVAGVAPDGDSSSERETRS